MAGSELAKKSRSICWKTKQAQKWAGGWPSSGLSLQGYFYTNSFLWNRAVAMVTEITVFLTFPAVKKSVGIRAGIER